MEKISQSIPPIHNSIINNNFLLESYSQHYIIHYLQYKCHNKSINYIN